MARKQAHKSMDQNEFRTPLGVLLLTEKGGVRTRYFPFGGPLVLRGIGLLVLKSHPSHAT
jgi:hypothetical protein